MPKLILKGLAAGQGIAEGVAKLFLPGNPASQFPQGAILVTTLTDPTMINAMIKAEAIVTDMGGITSHPAIIAREMGVPCVVGTIKATQLIRDGMKILVDGTKGEVYELD